MDYEKLHKDTITKLQEMVNSGKITVETARSICADFAPESEDERIRKHLISLFEKFVKLGVANECETSEIKVDDILAWLEKQGEPKDINPSEFDLRLNKLLKHFETLPKEELASSLSFYLNVVQNDVTYREEKQGEQKPADKVETKFNVGDWVVQNERKNIVKVVNATPLVYKVVDILGYHNTITNTAIESNYHLWTIKDAKDGDVLAYNDGSLTIFRYRLSGLDAGLYMSHVLLTNKIEFKQTCVINNVHPATKEQCDILMKAMADAGYTFDFEKKELKKFEQKATEWHEKTKNLDELETYIFSLVPNRPLDAIKVDSKNIRFIINKEQKPAWKPSKEQIRRLEYFLKLWGKTDDIENTKVFETVKSLLNDLKQL